MEAELNIFIVTVSVFIVKYVDPLIPGDLEYSVQG
jgi:hypothetical protein